MNEAFQPLVEALSRISKPSSESELGRRWLLPTMEGTEVLG